MISLYNTMLISLTIFSFGMISFLTRNNALFTLISIEIMFNSIALSFIFLSNYWKDINGQIIFLLIISCSAAEAAIGLAVLLKLYKIHKSLNVDLLNEMKK